MKAAVYDVEGAPGVLKYVDIPEPVTGPDDILISVEAISIEGGDLINRRSTPPPLPSWIVGYAAAGTVVDLVIDPVGTTLPASLSALAPQGCLVFVGNAGGGSLTVDLWPPMQSNQTLMGVFMGPLFERPGVRTSVDDMLQAVAAGRIRVVIDRIFPLANAAAAHEFAETAKPLGRIVMKP
ncbi:TPA: zinc-binding dehydrogenase [Citrobacter freundii]